MDVEILDIIEASTNKEIKFNISCGNDLIDIFLNSGQARHYTLINSSKNSVLVYEKQVIGFYTVSVEDLDYQEEKYKCIYIACFAIDKAYQKQGFGKQLLELIIAKSEEIIDFLGLMGIILKSVPNAKEFYEKNGFVQIETEVKKGDEDLIPMLIDFRRQEYFDYIEEMTYWGGKKNDNFN